MSTILKSPRSILGGPIPFVLSHFLLNAPPRPMALLAAVSLWLPVASDCVWGLAALQRLPPPPRPLFLFHVGHHHPADHWEFTKAVAGTLRHGGKALMPTTVSPPHSICHPGDFGCGLQEPPKADVSRSSRRKHGLAWKPFL